MKAYRPVRILISADKDNLGSLFVKILLDIGFASKVINRYESLFYELRGGDYSVLILTNNSLGPDEIIQLTLQIRHFHEKIKIIVLSGWTENEFPERIINAGASFFFPLPFEPDTFLRCVKTILADS